MKLIKLLIAAVLIMLAFSAVIANAGERKLSNERIVFHTNAGDIAIALYPDVAPKHAAQILKMVKAGVYKDVSIFRIEPGFVAQIDSFNPSDRSATAEQLQTVHEIPAEFSSIKHVRGLISMARYDDPDSATSSFSFMLGDAPHLDGKYTIIGEVVSGMDVLSAIEHVPTDESHHPLTPVQIGSAEIVSAKALPTVALTPAHEPEFPGGQNRILFGIIAALAFALTIGTAVWKTIFSDGKMPARS